MKKIIIVITALLYSFLGASLIYATDTTPDAFSFINQAGVELNKVVTSNSITVSGIDTAVPINIIGGVYSINGGSYTSDCGTVNNNDTVTVQLTSSGSYSTTMNATLAIGGPCGTLGGVCGTFSVTTQSLIYATDTTPDAFSFINQADVELYTVVTSNSITVSGIDTAVPISIIGGLYSINGGYYEGLSGTVNNNDTVTIQMTSMFGIYSGCTTATLTIGGVSGTFSVTTLSAVAAGVERISAVGFSIGSKGYVGTGSTGMLLLGEPIYTKDFWEYDPETNVWTQKADFGGSMRNLAVGFSIGSKGYIGTGYDDSGTTGTTKDFWEYDPAANTWTQKTDFGGASRWGAVGFSIGSRGYIGTGQQGASGFNDFWEYNPETNVWTRKADFGGGARFGAVGFSIGS